MSARLPSRYRSRAGRVHSALALIRRRLSDRGDTEHEQALIRIAIVGLLLVYAVFAPLPRLDLDWWVPSVAQVGYIVGTLSILHFVWIVVVPRVHHARRAVWMAIDHGGIVLAMAVGGEPMALLYPLLLWVTLGHGFRYGPRHLIGSALISTTLFAPLVLLHPFWAAKGAFGIGLILGLMLIPGYCYRLLHHLHDARRRAEASSEAKSRFLATMSHELRTPLHAILGMSDLLRGTPLKPDQRDMTRTIHTAGHGLLNMIEDVLDIARIEAGAARSDVEPFDVVQLLRGICDMLGYQARHKGLALRLRLDADLVSELAGARRSLEQTLINLVANAIKFTERGEVRVEAALVDVADQHGSLRLIVSDTGCGIPATAHAQIFDSFTQADETTTRRHGGSGLGLAIVKRVVELAGGTIGFQSAVGQGTRFEVRMPMLIIGDVDTQRTGLIAVHGVPTAAQRLELDATGYAWRPAAEIESVFISADCVDLWCRTPGAPAPLTRHGRDLIVWGERCGEEIEDALVVLDQSASRLQLLRAVHAALVLADGAEDVDSTGRVPPADTSLDVLVVDDHRINRDVMERLLVRGGHRAAVVESGEAALAALDQTSFDVVVLDLNMPGMGGFAAAREIRQRPHAPRLIALTADATNKTRDTCIAAGFDFFLTKPVDGGRLLEAVANDAPAATTPPPPSPTSTPMADASAVLDGRRIAMLRELDAGDGFVDDIIDGFVADGRALIDDIETAAAAGDVARFRDAAHALRSAATHLGATALFERCLEVKSLQEHVLRERAVAIGSDLDTAFAAVSRALLELRSNPGASPAVPSSSRVSSPPA